MYLADCICLRTFTYIHIYKRIWFTISTRSFRCFCNTTLFLLEDKQINAIKTKVFIFIFSFNCFTGICCWNWQQLNKVNSKVRDNSKIKNYVKKKYILIIARFNFKLPNIICIFSWIFIHLLMWFISFPLINS